MKNEMQRNHGADSKNEKHVVKYDSTFAERDHVKEEGIVPSRDGSLGKGPTTSQSHKSQQLEQFPHHGLPAGAILDMPAAGYPGYFPPHAYIPYGMSYEPTNPIFRGMNPALLGYHPGFVHPGQLRFPMTIPEKEKPMDNNKINQKHSITPSPSSAQHKICDLDDGKRKQKIKSEDEKPTKSSSTPPRAGYKTPPPQRHLHTHHHTHVVGPNYPAIYDPYSANG